VCLLVNLLFTEINFYHRNQFLSPQSIFITAINFYHRNQFLSPQSILSQHTKINVNTTRRSKSMRLSSMVVTLLSFTKTHLVQGFQVAMGIIQNHVVQHRVHGNQIHYEYFSRRNGSKNKRDDKPLMVFVHGGAWKTGSSRMHYQKPFVELLLESDVDVICCNYRKTRWPQPLQDVLATFEEIEQRHGDRPITFCGASAGGHLTILAYYYSSFFRKQQEGGVRPQHKMLLFYPAIDVFNQLEATQPLLFHSKPPRTLLNTFFETFVVPRDGPRHPDFPWVSPIELLESAPLATWKAWPATRVVHGKQDAITLFKASDYFVEGLRFLSGDDNKHTLLGVEGSHNFDIPDCPQTKRVYRGLVDWILD